ncbi:AbrB/MazE/SpoVT family DNA-binding domain-containing protein [archaeon]|nr:AbrB/MazE/SpoVT family DNA-binding domain-containing protein [archaeon]
MKRKVVQIAGFTKVISLPAEWVKKLNIKKGDELEIKEGDSTLTILAPKQNTFRKAHIDASKLNPIIIWPTLSLLHKTGYEEIKISGVDKEIMKIVYEKVQSSLFGFEVIEQTGDGFKNLCNSANTNTKIKVSAAVIDTFEDVNSLLERLQSLFYKFTLEELSDFSLKLHTTNSKINKLLRSNKGTDVTILANLLYITQTIHDFVGATIYLKADLDSNIKTE